MAVHKHKSQKVVTVGYTGAILGRIWSGQGLYSMPATMPAKDAASARSSAEAVAWFMSPKEHGDFSEIVDAHVSRVTRTVQVVTDCAGDVIEMIEHTVTRAIRLPTHEGWEQVPDEDEED